MIGIYRQIFQLMEPEDRPKLVILAAMIVVMGLIETVGIGAILPFLSVLAEPEQVTENRWLAAAYDAGGFTDRDSFLAAFGVAVFGLVIFGLLFKTLTLYAMTKFAFMRGCAISGRMLAGYLRQPYAWFLNRHSAEVANIVLSEVDQVVANIIVPAANLIAYAVIAICLTVLLLMVDPVVALSSAAVVGGAYGALFLGMRPVLARIGGERVVANRARFKITQEAMGGIKDVKLLGLEHQFHARFRTPAYRVAHYQTVAKIIGDTPRYLIEAVLFGGMILLVVQMILSGDGGLAGALPVLGLYAFAGLRLFPALQQIYHTLTRMRFARAALDKVCADLAEIEAGGLAAPRDDPQPIGLRQTLALRGVAYAYPAAERTALSGLDLEIPARTSVGIVGGTGAGKTTVVDVLLGLLQPDAGALVVDGVEITPERMRAWQRSIGYVPQQIFLTDDTVASNIAFGVPPGQVDHGAVARAARIAELDTVVRDLPEGFATLVGERGVRLSGGQRQRIGIARALYADPDVLVMDEATSALDNLTERAVIDALQNLGRTKTVIMIAHRLTTVRHCDQIFLLENGRIAARGPYDALIDRSETFRRMVGGR